MEFTVDVPVELRPFEGARYFKRTLAKIKFEGGQGLGQWRGASLVTLSCP